MKVDIGIERTRHLGARWLLDQGIPFAAPAARKPLRFLGGDKAFVEAHLAVLTDLDVHTAALALARMGMIPRPEPLAALHHDDIGPTGVQIVGDRKSTRLNSSTNAHLVC